MDNIIKQIETWKNEVIIQVIDDIKDAEVETLLTERYKNILKLIKGKKLIDLVDLPKKILNEEVICKSGWKPNEDDKLILQTLPITSIKIDFSIKKIPDWLGFLNLKNLRTFNISTWSTETFNELPSWIKECVNLETLLLFNVEFKKKSSLKEIESLSNLTSLSLKIDEWIDSKIDTKSIKKLEYISLDAGGSKYDNDFIYQKFCELAVFENLISIGIANYSFSKIPADWIKLSKLNRLWIEGDIVTKFIYSSADSVPSDFLSTEAAHYFLKTAITEDDQRKDEDFVFDFLESNNPTEIKKGLAIVETNGELKRQAEERYLNILKVMLDKPNVELKDLLDLKNTDQLVSLVQEFAYTDPEDLSSQFILDYKEADDCLAIVKLFGALTQNAVDIQSIIADANKMKDEWDLSTFIEDQCLKLKASLRKEFCKGLLSKGWLQTILEIFSSRSNFQAKQLRFNHTNFEKANNSDLLAEFHFFILAHSKLYSSITIDIAQSTQPNFTPVFWLYEDIPYTNWLDVEPVFPDSPLSFERTFDHNVE